MRKEAGDQWSTKCAQGDTGPWSTQCAQGAALRGEHMLRGDPLRTLSVLSALEQSISRVITNKFSPHLN